jgi:hypothetical protein
MREALDHPILFLVVVTVGVAAMMSIFRWGFKAANMPGPASVFGG